MSFVGKTSVNGNGFGAGEYPFDQPYTFLQRNPIPSSTLLVRSYYVIGFFLLIDAILVGFFIYKYMTKKNKMMNSEALLEVDPNASISLGLYTSDT